MDTKIKNASHEHTLNDIKEALLPWVFHPTKIIIQIDDQMYEIINKAFYEEAYKHKQSCEEETKPDAPVGANDADAEQKATESPVEESGSKDA